MNSLLHKSNLVVKPAMQFSKAKPTVQPKLTINTPGDKYEQEADAMADRVMRMTSNETAKPVTGLIGKSLQRKCSACSSAEVLTKGGEEEEKKKPIMRKAEGGISGMPVSSSFASSLNASKGGGSSLPQGTKSFMEKAFSTDFSKVCVHTGSQASEMSQGINAKAFTHGNDIYFGAGQYSPNSEHGKSLLAHELTHVEQQNNEMEKKIQRRDLFDGRPTGWEDWYEFVLDAANNFYKNDLNIDIDLPENKANLVHGCGTENSSYKNNTKLNKCFAKNPLNNSKSPQVTVIWWPNIKEVNVKSSTLVCRYNYKHGSKGYVFTKLSCSPIAVY